MKKQKSKKKKPKPPDNPSFPPHSSPAAFFCVHSLIGLILIYLLSFPWFGRAKMERTSSILFLLTIVLTLSTQFAPGPPPPSNICEEALQNMSSLTSTYNGSTISTLSILPPFFLQTLTKKEKSESVHGVGLIFHFHCQPHGR